MVSLTLLLLLLLLLVAPAHAASGLTAEVYANSVMRGTAVCTHVVPNGWKVESAHELCPAWNGVFMPDQVSIRLTGTLTAQSPAQWHRFTATVGPTAMVRLWVDDHRIVDAWGPRTGPDTDSPSTPALLPNVTIGAERPVFVRVDLRPANLSTPVSFSLDWTVDPAAEAPTTPIPQSALSPNVSATQLQRRLLQEAASTGWNHWARRSQLAQIALPQHVGVELR